MGLSSKTLDQAAILEMSKCKWLGRSLVILDSCASTNDVAMALGDDGAVQGTVVIADTQQAGRGRFGRTWYSPRGGVWLSILIRPQGPPYRPNSLPLIGALATARVLRQTCAVKACVRWPNDVVVDSRKIAGVLVESKSKGNDLLYTTVGIGVNANFDTDDVEPISNSSTSLLTLIGRPINREKLISAILSEFETLYEQAEEPEAKEILALLRKLDWSTGRHVKISTVDREIVGLFEDYESLFRVRIATKSGLEWVETHGAISVDYESN